MNNNLELGKRVLFKPSARKSIHSHDNCPFKIVEMGRYGLNKLKENRENTRNASHCNYPLPLDHLCGTDEVDRGVSKSTSTVNPHLEDNKDTHRRQSLDFTHEDDWENISDIEKMVSKSLPAELPSYYRHDSNQWSLQENNKTNEHMEMMRQSYEYSPEKFLNNSPKNGSELRKHDYRQKSDYALHYTIRKYTSVIILSLGLLAAYIYSSLNNTPEKNIIIYDELKFYNDLNVLKDKYNINDNAILLIRTGISTIFKKEDAASFVIAYNSKNNNFNQLEFHNFVNDVVSTTARYLRNDTPTPHIEIDSSSLDMHTHSEFINKYRNDVLKSGAMLVRELDRVPSSLAMAFHYYCDEYNPLVKKSAIFFTLNLENCSDFSAQKSTHAFIEKCLAKKWRSLPQDNINPLLTRIVNVVVDVTNNVF